MGPDGELLDASDIQFFNDPDDDVPIPAVPEATSTPSGGQATHITQFFRRSDRARKRSSRLTDPNNVEVAKRKANETGDTRPSVRARRSAPSPAPMDEDDNTPADDDDDDMPDLADPSDSEDGGDNESVNDGDDKTDDEEINAAYEYTKSLGDADRAVRNPAPCH